MSAKCPHCGASMKQHVHHLNVPLVSALFKLNKAGGGPLNLKTLGLTRNQWDNFQKLRYWGLVEKSRHEDGTRKAGVWHITDRGVRFLGGACSLKRTVVTYRGEPVRFQNEHVSVRDVIAKGARKYRTREDYAKDAR